MLWNHRWDHDKAPEVFFRALRRLDHDGVAFRLALAGANVRSDPREFVEAEERFVDRLVHVGHLDRERYLELLVRSSVVASTAVHEFFGIAMVEAMAAGLVPLLPRALSYPELVAREFQAAVLYDSYGDLVRRLREVLVDLDAARQAIDGLRKSMLRFDWTELGPRLRRGAGRRRRRVASPTRCRSDHRRGRGPRRPLDRRGRPDRLHGGAPARGHDRLGRGAGRRAGDPRARRARCRAGSSTGSTRSCSPAARPSGWRRPTG